ncbi:hypothetical protein Pyrfu_1750 [Pyrolobus fumarii 1A]|uniref:PaREP1 family protein n=1 Tax=Pyrolobus fumarii (strain DSM 11204 / 1A) TaxID=694429 RepID=G0ECN4_PYRF1|nr:hypothetical protein [Pyrolobus fumarii]AEM39604.1 hypothetical protein Pyrfu_1750 [Pyrolobus fumarii 1A]
MDRLQRILLEYLYTLKWREYVLRRGRAALASCSRGIYPGFESLAQLYSLLGGLARRVRNEGEALRASDPALWFFTMRYGDLDEAARELARASVEVRLVAEKGCEDAHIDHAMSVTTAAWRDTLTAVGLLTRKLNITG